MGTAMNPEMLHDSIVSFRKANSRQKPIARCHCGAAMERYIATCFYDGLSWDVVLEGCSKCNPAIDAPISYDA
jgi:hypothetical protein